MLILCWFVVRGKYCSLAEKYCWSSSSEHGMLPTKWCKQPMRAVKNTENWEPNRKYRNRIFRYPIRFLILRNRNYWGKFGFFNSSLFFSGNQIYWITWNVLSLSVLYCWLYYCRLLYYVFVVLTLIVLWTYIYIYILHYYSLWNHVKISFWACYYVSLCSVRYCSVNTETEPKVPKPNFFGTDF
jgi:hypothetical protein